MQATSLFLTAFVWQGWAALNGVEVNGGSEGSSVCGDEEGRQAWLDMEASEIAFDVYKVSSDFAKATILYRNTYSFPSFCEKIY